MRSKPLKLKPLKAVDFFCGAGGVTCGFKKAGIEVLGGIDIDSSCKSTYEKNNKAIFINKDIGELSFLYLTKCLGIRKDDNELIFIGCSPCQYFTNLKTDKTKSKKTRLLLENFQEFVDYFKPGYVFIENVPGLNKKAETPLFRFKEFLLKNGYCFDDGILNAKYFGVPQNRRRYVLIASRVSKIICLPKEDKRTVKTVREAIGDKKNFPPIPAGHIDLTSHIHSAAKLSDLNLQRLITILHRRAWENDEALQLKCYKHNKGH
ncbi:MAG: DNA cytosine methyltransferase [Saprospiraceae bacterium]